jgi:hypothetical protein
MANALFSKCLQAFLDGQISWTNDPIKAVLINSDIYTPNFALHNSLTNIPTAARMATSPSLTGKSSLDGVADADDVTFTEFAVTGIEAGAIVLYKDTGDPQTSTLIAYFDSATGLPVTVNGGDVTVVFDNSVNKVFRL